MEKMDTYDFLKKELKTIGINKLDNPFITHEEINPNELTFVIQINTRVDNKDYLGLLIKNKLWHIFRSGEMYEAVADQYRAEIKQTAVDVMSLLNEIKETAEDKLL